MESRGFQAYREGACLSGEVDNVTIDLN